MISQRLPKTATTSATLCENLSPCRLAGRNRWSWMEPLEWGSCSPTLDGKWTAIFKANLAKGARVHRPPWPRESMSWEASTGILVGCRESQHRDHDGEFCSERLYGNSAVTT